MKLRNKKTGKIADVESLGHAESLKEKYGYQVTLYWKTEYENLSQCKDYDSLAELNEEWEDYEPVEPIFDEKIRRGIRAWWDMQDNPFKTACVLLVSKDKDLDGFYHWTIFGYIRNGEEKMSTQLEFRTKKLYSYKPHHDYTKEELCGEEG